MYSKNNKNYDNVSFSDFVVTPENREAYESAVYVAEHPGMDKNPLFILDEEAETAPLLMSGIADRILQTDPSAAIFCCTGGELHDAFMTCRHSSIRPVQTKEEFNEMLLLLQKANTADILMIQNVDFYYKYSCLFSKEDFLALMNEALKSGKQIVFSLSALPVNRRNPGELFDHEPENLCLTSVNMSSFAQNYSLVSFGDQQILEQIPAMDFSSFYVPSEDMEETIDSSVCLDARPYLRKFENTCVMDYYFCSVHAPFNLVYRYLQTAEHLFSEDVEADFFLRIRQSEYEHSSCGLFLEHIQKTFPDFNIAAYTDYDITFLNHAYYAFGDPDGIKGTLAKSNLIRLAVESENFKELNENAKTPDAVFELPLKLLYFLERCHRLLQEAVLETPDTRHRFLHAYRSAEEIYPELSGMTLPMVFACEEAAGSRFGGFDQLENLLPEITTPADGTIYERKSCVENGNYLIYSFKHMSRNDYDEIISRAEANLINIEELLDRTEFLRSEGRFREAYSIDSQVHAYLHLQEGDSEQCMKYKILLARDLNGMQEDCASVGILYHALPTCRKTLGDTHALALEMMFELMHSLMEIRHYKDAELIGTELLDLYAKAGKDPVWVLELFKWINAYKEIYNTEDDLV